VSCTPADNMGFSFSFFGDGIRPMLTGSEDPSNQDASPLATAPLVFGRSIASSFTSYSAASSGETRSGDAFRLVDLIEGRKAEKRVGEVDDVRVTSGGRSVVVREREWPRSAGGGNVMVGPFSSKGVGGDFFSGMLERVCG
jgi:hypothetical protein